MKNRFRLVWVTLRTYRSACGDSSLRVNALDNLCRKARGFVRRSYSKGRNSRKNIEICMKTVDSVTNHLIFVHFYIDAFSYSQFIYRCTDEYLIKRMCFVQFIFFSTDEH